jgi:hypothetical protein
MRQIREDRLMQLREDGGRTSQNRWQHTEWSATLIALARAVVNDFATRFSE